MALSAHSDFLFCSLQLLLWTWKVLNYFDSSLLQVYICSANNFMDHAFEKCCWSFLILIAEFLWLLDVLPSCLHHKEPFNINIFYFSNWFKMSEIDMAVIKPEVWYYWLIGKCTKSLQVVKFSEVRVSNPQGLCLYLD